MVAHNGTTFGGFERPADADKTSRTVSNDGIILVYKLISLYQKKGLVTAHRHCRFRQSLILR